MVDLDVNASVFRITSSDSDNHNFGSSFAFYRDFNDAVYFLTCRHVLMDVGGPEQARVGNYQAEMVASGSEDGLDDLAVLRVQDRPDVPLLQLSVSAERGSPIIVAGFRRFARSLLIRQIRGTLGQQIGLETRQRPGRVTAWDLTIEDDYDLEQGYSGAPVVDERSGQVIAVASHRLGGAKGVAIAVETLESIWPRWLNRIRDSYPANAFSRAIAVLGRGAKHARVEPAILQRFRTSSRVEFLTAATTIAPLSKELRAFATIRADGLTEEEIRHLVDRWLACVKDVGTERVGTDRRKHGHLFFLFDYGCSEEMVDLIKEVGVRRVGAIHNKSQYELPLAELSFLHTNPQISDPEILISSYIIDFKEGCIHTASAAMWGQSVFPEEPLLDLLNRSTHQFLPH